MDDIRRLDSVGPDFLPIEHIRSINAHSAFLFRFEITYTSLEIPLQDSFSRYGPINFDPHANIHLLRCFFPPREREEGIQPLDDDYLVRGKREDGRRRGSGIFGFVREEEERNLLGLRRAEGVYEGQVLFSVERECCALQISSRAIIR